jgi:hypothetical protein
MKNKTEESKHQWIRTGMTAFFEVTKLIVALIRN